MNWTYDLYIGTNWVLPAVYSVIPRKLFYFFETVQQSGKDITEDYRGSCGAKSYTECFLLVIACLFLATVVTTLAWLFSDSRIASRGWSIRLLRNSINLKRKVAELSEVRPACINPAAGLRTTLVNVVTQSIDYSGIPCHWNYCEPRYSPVFGTNMQEWVWHFVGNRNRSHIRISRFCTGSYSRVVWFWAFESRFSFELLPSPFD